MAHNYAKPLTAQARLERVLSRIPDDWTIRCERLGEQKVWKVFLQPPNQSGAWSSPSLILAEAFEEVWRMLR